MTQTRDPATGQIFDGGAAHVETVNAGAPSGTLVMHTMLPDDGTPDAANIFEVWSNATGCKAFYIQSQDTIPTGANEQILLVAASTSFGGSTAADLATILDSADADCTSATPSGDPSDGVIKITANDLSTIMVNWDGTDTIKTISMRWALLSGTIDETIRVTLNTIEA